MTIDKVIENVRRKKAGYNIDDEFIIENINRVEMDLIIRFAEGREGESEVKADFGNYDVHTDRNRKLLAGAPFDLLYETYVCAQVDLEYEDSERYENDLIQYNNLLEEFGIYFCRTHRQKRHYTYHY